MVKQRSGGRYYDSITIAGKRIYFYSSAATVKAAEKEIKRKIIQYKEKEERGRLFDDVAKEWWYEHSENIAVQSRMSYSPCLNRAIDYFGNVPVKEINSQDVKNFLQYLANRRYSTKSISQNKLVLSLILSYAVTYGIIETNPCSGIKVQKTTKTVRKSASEHDEKIILSTNDDYVVPLIALCCGLRAGEIYGLRWDDIDFNSNIIHVRRSIGHDNSRPIINTPKTESGYRDVPMIARVRDKLYEIRKSAGYIVSGDGLLSKQQYQTMYNKYKSKYGITANLHELRHSCATYLIEGGVDVKTAATILGHSDVSVTLQIYTDVKSKALDSAANKLSSALENLTPF